MKNALVHFKERRKMILHQRAIHERLRNNIISNANELKNIKISGESSRVGRGQTHDNTKIAFDKMLHGYRSIMDDMITKQQMEADALAAVQTLENDCSAPSVQVSFPFPDIFDHARQIFYSS
eukprot:CAMPEP_0203722704 /NCGR_PEP_ID=MMETSP0092-20131115/5809_1 /ASSEMBLY_ACC=CAM_ASM_001090 /TAXON_ID=426623 /ORGANISM="Chaetoceros affinis, Strain CCMP159" /LENGTH=121 /DNA_ID=CAMNT_0050602887 /DNA_START=63 /DNA_END=428 /DNA_ORIENTATION=-